jgi:hypothetical protein
MPQATTLSPIYFHIVAQREGYGYLPQKFYQFYLNGSETASGIEDTRLLRNIHIEARAFKSST